MVAGGVLLSSVAVFAAGTGGILTMILRMIFNDVQAFILKKKKLNIDNNAVYMILGGSGLAFLAYGILTTSYIHLHSSASPTITFYQVYGLFLSY
ncbi:MAG: hypothetical protein ACYCYM_02155 [Saccharofermentanales bacterium]